MWMMRLLLGIVSVLAMPVLVQSGMAASPEEAGPEFRFVGEYVGDLQVRESHSWRRVPIGMQVVARGNGQFDIVEYYGGLPGAGWNGVDRVVLPGEIEGSRLHVRAEPINFFIDGFAVQVGTPWKTSVFGTLRRIDRASPTLGRRAPREATILMGNGEAPGFKNAKLTPDGLLIEGAETIEAYSDFMMHVEFRVPFMPSKKSQGRGNSGVYLQRRYEVQILDSFGDEAVFNGVGALYRTKTPDVNMALPPLTWQTFDIEFQAARFEGNQKIRNARITVWHNGVKIHDHYEIANKTGAGKSEDPSPLPILLQDHNDPVRFRNVWIVDRTLHPKAAAVPRIDRAPSLAEPLQTAPAAACEPAICY